NPSQEYRDITLRLEPGETILFYTDGVTEAMNPKRELYSSRRLREFVASGPSELPDLIEGIVADVEAFCEGRPQSDDICLVGFTRTK
ncbi:MAG: serine/threonine-protein phosphatase, partial [Planctomycetes bacterium]|nr:serine/threonine-protein phosphatase [Planctomycetota bacterium]